MDGISTYICLDNYPPIHRMSVGMLCRGSKLQGRQPPTGTKYQGPRVGTITSLQAAASKSALNSGYMGVAPKN